jgi:hypothetical protein
MDDLFQYLIYGVIIFSFLSSFFKKKEPPKQTPQKPAQKPESISYQQRSAKVEPDIIAQKNDEYDILRELENLFKGEIKIPEQQKPKQVDSYDVYQPREIKDKNLDLVLDKRMQRGVEDKKPIGSRSTYDDKIVYDRKNVDAKQMLARAVDSKIEASAREFEKVLAGPRKQRAAITDFNRKLKNPSTVREYILFSEILGKPKALRR